MSSRSVCPFCNGGSSKERSFVVSDDGLYICHRASCGASGKWGSHLISGGASTAKPKLVMPEVKGITVQALNDIASLYHMDTGAISRLRPGLTVLRGGEERWWYPIFGPHGEERGGVARINGGTPKVLTFVEDGYTLGSWYTTREDMTDVALVEDQVSAARLSKYVTTVALLGCNLSHDLTMYLARHGCKRLHIALDADAISNATKIAAKVSLYFRYCSVVTLSKDIKNSTDSEIEQCIIPQIFP